MPVKTSGRFYERVRHPSSHPNSLRSRGSKIQKISKRGKRMSNRGRR